MLLIGLAVLGPVGCKAASQGSAPDGGTQDGGIDGDAFVDNGPLDCGTAPMSDATCIRGRLYDFETDQPTYSGVEVEVFTFDPEDYFNRRDHPGAPLGRLDPNGRFYVWADTLYGDECIALKGDRPLTEGMRGVNCYSHEFQMPPPGFISAGGEYRFYLVSPALGDTWAQTYPGPADIATDSFFYLGTCRNPDYSLQRPGLFRFLTMVPPTWPQSYHGLSITKTRFLDIFPTEDLPDSSAVLYWTPMTDGVSEQTSLITFFTCASPAGTQTGEARSEWKRTYDESHEFSITFLNSLGE